MPCDRLNYHPLPCDRLNYHPLPCDRLNWHTLLNQWEDMKFTWNIIIYTIICLKLYMDGFHYWLTLFYYLQILGDISLYSQHVDLYHSRNGHIWKGYFWNSWIGLVLYVFLVFWSFCHQVQTLIQRFNLMNSNDLFSYQHWFSSNHTNIFFSKKTDLSSFDFNFLNWSLLNYVICKSIKQ